MVTVFKNQIATQDQIDKINEDLKNKVDKDGDKGLSTNDFNDSYKKQLQELPSELETIKDSLNEKVDKVDGKGLSTKDFTGEHETKLDNLPESDELENRFETKADKDSLAAVATTGSYYDLKDIPSASNTIDLLDKNNLSKWSIERQPTDEGDYIGHYAGAVDLSDKELSGVSGALVQLATDSFYSAWTDFKYSDTVSLGNNFQFKITPFIKTNGYNSGKQIFEDSFVDVKLGIFSIRLFRWASDMYDTDGETQQYNNNNFYKLRVGLCLDDQLAAFSDVITILNSQDITTDICDGDPASTELGEANSDLIKYMRTICLNQQGSEYGPHSTTTFTTNEGFQDLTVVYNNETIQILNVNNKPLKFNIFLPTEQDSIVEVPLVEAGCQDDASGIIDFQKVIELSEGLGLSLPIPTFNDIKIKVRCYHDRAAALYHPLALMRYIIEPLIPVEKGGTGAVTAEQARKNLGAAKVEDYSGMTILQDSDFWITISMPQDNGDIINWELQQVSCQGLLINDTPIIDVDLGGYDPEANKSILEAWACVQKAEVQEDNKINFYIADSALLPLPTNIPIKVKVVR